MQWTCTVNRKPFFFILLHEYRLKIYRLTSVTKHFCRLTNKYWIWRISVYSLSLETASTGMCWTEEHPRTSNLQWLQHTNLNMVEYLHLRCLYSTVRTSNALLHCYLLPRTHYWVSNIIMQRSLSIWSKLHYTDTNDRFQCFIQ